MALSVKPQRNLQNLITAGCLCIAALIMALADLRLAAATPSVSLSLSPSSKVPACPKDTLTFICETVGSATPATLVWSSDKYIGGRDAECKFISTGPNGRVFESCNTVVSTTVATLTVNSLNEQNETVLRSQLEIVADNSTGANNITCTNQEHGISQTTSFTFVEPPGPPFDVAVIETPDNSESDSNCLLHVQVCPPLNLPPNDVSQYLFNPNSEPNQTFTGTTASFIMRKCTPDVRVTVAAVNRCNQVGASTRPLRPFFMEDVDDRPAISVERVIDSDALPVAISGVSIVIFVVFWLGVITIVIAVVWKLSKKNTKYADMPMQEMKHSSSQHSKEFSTEEIRSIVAKEVQSVWSEMSIKQRGVGKEEHAELLEKS